jgi:hypothetical protein
MAQGAKARSKRKEQQQEQQQQKLPLCKIEKERRPKDRRSCLVGEDTMPDNLRMAGHLSSVVGNRNSVT